MSVLSVAIVGAGNIAGGYDKKKINGDTGIYTHAGAYLAHGGFRLDTVFDLDRNYADTFRHKWGGARTAENLEEIYGRTHDVISVCTPNETHFDIVRNILAAGCCRTVFVEKPLAADVGQIEKIIVLAEKQGINVVVNFQRRNEPVHREIRDFIVAHPESLLSMRALYMKGLQHIGVTMLDTISHLCGYPEAVLAFNQVYNREVGEHSYEFVLYYPGFTVTVNTTDAERFIYNYHIFEIDLLFSDRRQTLIDTSKVVRESSVTSYAYSGVKVMNDREARYLETGQPYSMRSAAEYVFEVTGGRVAHTINTPQSSFNNQLIINNIIESFERGSVKLHFEQGLWKK